MIRPCSRRSALIALPMTLCCAAALAAPTVVPYSGYLTGADGQPYEGGADVMAALYPCSQAGDGTCDSVYEAPAFLGLTVAGGVLAFELGAEAESTLAEVLTEGSDLWLEIALRLDGAATWTLLEPRHRLQSVPYAVSAHDADRLGGVDAADYAMAAEIAAHVSLVQIAEAGYLDASQLATAGYVTTDVLADYALQSALSGYATTEDLDAYLTFGDLGNTLDNYVLASGLSDYIHEDELSDQLASYVQTASLQAAIAAELGGFVTDADLTSALSGYIDQSALDGALDAYVESTDLAAAVTAQLPGIVTTTALSAALAGYVEQSDLASYVTLTAHSAALELLALKAEAYTDGDAIAAVTAAGFLGPGALYTDADALSAVEAEGYARLTDIPSHGVSTQAVTSSISLASDITDEKTVTLSFPVAAKIAKSHIRVDLQIRTELSLDYMDYGLSPPASVAAEVTHNVHLESGFAAPPLYTDRLIQSPPREAGDSIAKGDIKQYSYFFELSDGELTEGADLEVALTAKCYAIPAETDIGCSVYVGLERITISGY